MPGRYRQLRMRDPDVFLLLPAASLAHCHARILRTIPVDHISFCFTYPDLHHGLLGGNMAVQTLSLEVIQDFLAQKRIAMVGISREPQSFSVSLFEELCRRGYDVVPVNPNTPNVQGRRCFARLQDIKPPVDAVLLMTSPTITESV